MPAATTCCRARSTAATTPTTRGSAGNNPAGNAAYVTDATCPKSGDPLGGVAGGEHRLRRRHVRGAVALRARRRRRSRTTSSSLRHYWFAPPLTNYPTERTYTLASFGDVFYSGTGLFRQAEQDALGGRGPLVRLPRRAPVRGRGHRADHHDARRLEARRPQRPNAPYLTVSTGCYTDDGSACSLGTDGAGNVGTAFVQLIGSRVTITDNTAPALGAPDRPGRACWRPARASGDEPVTFSATDNVGIRRAEIVDVTDAANPSVVACEGLHRDARRPERPVRLHEAAAVPGPQERDDRRVARDRRQAHAAAARHRRRGQPDRLAALRRHGARPGQRRGRRRRRRASSPASPATRSAAAARRARRSACCARPRRSAGVTAPRVRGDPAQRRRPAGGGRRAAPARARAAPRRRATSIAAR